MGQRKRLTRWAPEATVFLVVWIALLWFGRERMFRDPGTFWHVVVGERMLNTGEPVTTDSFSFTQYGRPWIAQQWLGECMMAVVHRIAGFDGMLLVSVTLLALTFAYVGRRWFRTGLPGPVVAIMLLLLAGACSYHFLPRPHLVTIALTAWVYGLLCDVEAKRRTGRVLLCIPIVFAIWTNIHGGVLGSIVTSVAVLAYWLLFARSRPDLSGRASPAASVRVHRAPLLLGVVICLSIGSVLLNPYGSRLPAVWLGLMGSDVLPRLIIEHAPLQFFSTEGTMILGLAAVYLFVLAQTWPRDRRVTWLIPLIWLVLALGRVRHGPLFAMTASIAIADMLTVSPIIGRLKARGWSICPKPVTTRATLVLTALGLFVASATLQATGVRCPLIGAGWVRLDESRWPVAATRALREYVNRHGSEVRIFNDMLYGGFLIYSVPEARVFVDDRCELYGDWGLLHYAGIRRRPETLDALAMYDDIRLAMVGAGSRMDAYLNGNPGWRSLHRDATASLYARAAAGGGDLSSRSN
ncbi:MAG: hypothetical protein O7D94_00495 [Planctomycetota bacterium]|nr:hypothetical protein [Planctomycetota bacterium]